MITPEIYQIISDFAASDWLKRALEAAIDRDAVDAANDAETLARVLRDRCNRMQANGAL